MKVKLILFLLGLLIAGNSLANNDDSFEETYKKILAQSYENQMMHYLLQEKLDSKQVSQAEIKELQKLKCASYLSEFEFYEFTLANIDEFKAYQTKERLNPHKVSKDKLGQDYLDAENRMKSENLSCR